MCGGEDPRCEAPAQRLSCSSAHHDAVRSSNRGHVVPGALRGGTASQTEVKRTEASHGGLRHAWRALETAMRRRRPWARAAEGVGAAVALLVSVACSDGGGGAVAPNVVIGTPDATATRSYDGTVGMPCAADGDCQPAGGARVNRCSLTAFPSGALSPTPVCVLPACQPGAGNAIRWCDGPNPAKSAPGVCVATGASGVCLPACTFAADGSAPKGCAGKDVCNFTGWATDAATGSVYGVGYCLGGCVTDAECPAGNACDSNSGLCMKSVTPAVLPLGESCNPSAQNPGCNCFGNSSSTIGYCTQFCVTGSTRAVCPGGYVCDAAEPRRLVGDNDAAISGFMVQNVGLGGSCLAACDGNADAVAEGGVDADVLESGIDGDGVTPLDAANPDGSGPDGSNASLDSSAQAQDGNTDARGEGGDGAALISGCTAGIACRSDNAAGPDCLP